MFMLWAIPAGIIAGLALGGRLGNLAAFRFRWGALAVLGLIVQVVLFTPSGDRLAGGFGPAIYIASTLVVFLAVLRNIRLPGMPIVALGAVSNLAAIGANGGFMPASREALATAGFEDEGQHTNSIVLENPALEPLTDIFALPASMPFANVFSVGDVLIAAGIVIVIVATMRRPVPAAGAAAATRGPAATRGGDGASPGGSGGAVSGAPAQGGDAGVHRP